MFTQCPECKTPRNLTIEQLREQRAIVFCPDCGIRYDALELLSEGAPLVESTDLPQPLTTTVNKLPIDYKPEIEENHGPLPWEERRAPTPGPKLWAYGCAGGLLLLIAQIYFFQHRQWLQNTTVRTWLDPICRRIDCRLPAYRDPDALIVLHGALQPLPDNRLRFEATFTNTARLSQPYPAIKLTLLRLNGEIFATRIFNPQLYLPHAGNTPFIGADETVQINLSLRKPHLPIGGYQFELI